MGICPYCETQLMTVDIDAVTLSAANMTQFQGLSYSCPQCQKILSVSVDPTAQESNIAQLLKSALQPA